MIQWMQFFPYVVAVLELAAGVVYYAYGQNRLALVWLFYGLACMALAGVK